MAVYGIGATYGGTDDRSETFIRMGLACIGWSPEEAPAVHGQMSAIKGGDLIFIKSFPPNSGLHIKAVGVVIDPRSRKISDALGWGIDVRWRGLPETILVGALEDRSDFMRRGSLYEEFNPSVIRQVLDALIPRGA
jgi:hypothetical protein